MKLFESQWAGVKESLLEGADLTHNMDGSVNHNKKKTMNLLLENTRRSLMEAASTGATSAAQIAQLNKVILPVMRRVMPTVIANEIVGVQPMAGPIAQIHTMRVAYAEAIAGGVAAGDEALSPLNIARYYSGDTSDVANPAGAATGTLEGVPGRAIKISTLRQTVEAKSRKLSARWTFESAQDAQAQQGIDVEQEVMAALAQEITAEIDQEILFHLRALAGTTQTFSQAAVTGTPTFIGDVHAALAIQINRAANIIASRTRRGAGNWAVVSPTALTILQSATTSGFARSTDGVFDAPTNTKFVGTLNNTIRVYVDGYGVDATPVLVGYKGNETDAAAFYCPYVPLTSTGVVIDPATMEPVVSFMSRYGYVELSNNATSLGNAADYVSKINIDTTSLTWM
jgi:hypothetical protein